jgi:Lon protease-like protein
MDHEHPELAGFNGTARLFPLPNLVLFPGMVQGLHVFEPRYRQMTADALADDRLIALALLRPGWEKDYYGKPELFPVACLGKVFAEQRLEDGRYNLQLRGLCRVQLLDEVPDDRLYRSARVEVLDESNSPEPGQEKEYRAQFMSRVPAWCAPQGPVQEAFAKLLKSKLPFGMLCDIVSFSLPLPLEFKQQMLATLDVEARARALLSYLEQHSPGETEEPAKKPFPPGFSVN